MNNLSAGGLSTSMNNMSLSNNFNMASGSSSSMQSSEEISTGTTAGFTPYDVTSNVLPSESTQNAAMVGSGNPGISFDGSVDVNNGDDEAEDDGDEDYEDDAEDYDEGDD